MEDTGFLARLNKQLIEDEGSRNPMTEAELEIRMKKLLAEGWRADLILREKRAIGYALYQLRRDDYDPCAPVVHLRQYCIDREERGRGYGRRGVELLMEQRFPTGSTVEIDVLASNSAGQRFWRALGFTPYSTAMKLPGRAVDSMGGRGVSSGR